MRLVLLRDLHFMCIFIGAVKSELLTSHFKVTLWGFDLISNYHPSITKRTADINTPSHHCLSIHLPNPTPSHCLSSIRLSKCMRNEGCSIFYKSLEKEQQKAFSQCWNSKGYSCFHHYKTGVLWLNLLSSYWYFAKTRLFFKGVLIHWQSLISPEN